MSHHLLTHIVSVEPAAAENAVTQRPYDPPAVVYEARLEVRAGTPVGIIPDGTNPLDLP